MGEFRHVQVETGGEAFDEAAAARRTRFVQHDVVDNAILHTQAFHVLPANVQDEFHARQHLLRTAQVRHRLYLAGIHPQRLEQQSLAVTCHRGMPDAHARYACFRIDRQVVVQIRKRRLRAPQHIAFVVGVMRPQKRAVLTDERRLERGRTGIDTQIRRARIGHEVAPAHAFRVVARLELLIIFLGGEQRIEPHDLRTLHVAQPAQALEHVGQALGTHGFACRARNGAPARHEQVGVFRNDAMLFVKLERFVEALAQFGKILQRPAQKRHVPADGPPARQTGNGLRHH